MIRLFISLSQLILSPVTSLDWDTPTSSYSTLLATDIISGAICLNIIDDSKAVSVIQGLKLLALRYRISQRLIVDAGSQLVSLNTTNKDLLEALANHDVQVTPLPAGHQFGNTIERLIQILKRIFNSLREDKTLASTTRNKPCKSSMAGPC